MFKENLIGRRFGRLVVMTDEQEARGTPTKWYCECDCGGSTVARSHDLKMGVTKSCGCLKGAKQDCFGGT